MTTINWYLQFGADAPGPSVEYSYFMPFVLPYANGCPDLTAEFHVRQAAIEFFQRSLAWRQDLDAVMTVADQDAYSIPAPSGSSIVKLLSYTYDGSGGSLVDVDMGKALVLNQSGVEVGWSIDRATFTVNPVPAEDDLEIVLHVALKPSQASTSIPATMFEQYVQYIAHGALAGVLDIPGEPWTNPAKAADYRSMFNADIARVGAIVAKAAGRASGRTKAFYF